jgi:Undecaprenyl-phosphate glucose phosphotransferase
MNMVPGSASWLGASAVKGSKRTRWMRAAFVVLAGATDAAVILLASVGTGAFYHHIAYGDFGNIVDFVQIGLAAAWLYLIPCIYLGDYSVTNYIERRMRARRISRLWTLAFVCLITIGFLTKSSEAYSRGWLVLFYLAGLPVLIFAHVLFVHVLAAGSQTGLIVAHRLLLVGLPDEINDFLERHRPWSRGLEIVGIATLSRPDSFGNATQSRRFDEALDATVRRARGLDLDGVFLAVPWSDQEVITRCAEAFMTVPASIHLTPSQLFDRFGNISVARVGPVASLHLLRPPLSLLSIILKRVCDFILAAGILVGMLPLMLLVALAIKLDSRGPVFFVQRRYGFNQRPFAIIKFRTMTTLEDDANIAQATRDDRRVTRVGRYLRRWNIDELPQLINVLRGDMSLVGPRPHALAHDRAWGRTIALYARRHNVKPGITGWAQVNGYRGLIDSDERLQGRIACDLYYIDNWSVWLDIKILVATVFWPGAYRNAH